MPPSQRGQRCPPEMGKETWGFSSRDGRAAEMALPPRLSSHGDEGPGSGHLHPSEMGAKAALGSAGAHCWQGSTLRSVRVSSMRALLVLDTAGPQGQCAPPGLFLSRPSSPPPQAAPLGFWEHPLSPPIHQGDAAGARAIPGGRAGRAGARSGPAPEPPDLGSALPPQVHCLPGD